MTKSVKQAAELKKKAFSRAQRELPNFSKGLVAEDTALSYLESKGYVLVQRNLAFKQFEIDLVVLDQAVDELVFCEVKYRHTKTYGEGWEAVDARKIAKMHRVAQKYLEKQRVQKSYRFDIISIVGSLDHPEIQHFENITWL